MLSRDLAESAHFPAIDIEKSISRVMNSVTDGPHLEAARRFRQLHSKYQKARDLIQLGAYVPGHDTELDIAVRMHHAMMAVLQQNQYERATLAQSIGQLRQIMPA